MRSTQHTLSSVRHSKALPGACWQQRVVVVALVCVAQLHIGSGLFCEAVVSAWTADLGSVLS